MPCRAAYCCIAWRQSDLEALAVCKRPSFWSSERTSLSLGPSCQVPAVLLDKNPSRILAETSPELSPASGSRNSLRSILLLRVLLQNTNIASFASVFHLLM